jgi:hypothetical protein
MLLLRLLELVQYACRARQRLKFWEASSVQARTQLWVFSDGRKVQRWSRDLSRGANSMSKPFTIVRNPGGTEL